MHRADGRPRLMIRDVEASTCLYDIAIGDEHIAAVSLLVRSLLWGHRNAIFSVAVPQLTSAAYSLSRPSWSIRVECQTTVLCWRHLPWSSGSAKVHSAHRCREQSPACCQQPGPKARLATYRCCVAMVLIRDCVATNGVLAILSDGTPHGEESSRGTHVVV